MPSLAPGERLGPYEILSLLGEGGMGQVWKARDPRLNRVVAVKYLKGTHSSRFEQEAHAVAALNHPHICQIYDIGPDYLVMEFIDGAPLRGPLAPEEALRLALQITDALIEAHGAGILHRDLKPANILVTAKGTAKLLDFGLAKLLTGSDAEATQTIEGTVAGTAAYMSPEQAQGKPLDERSDVFSFGAVLYEMLSGARAFSGGSTVDVLSAILRDEPRALPGPPEITRIVVRCLRKGPAERYQSIAEVKAALEAVAAKPVERQPSIAVLPFANMSGDKEQEYFSDGLAEEIINALVKIPGLRVIARTSAFAFKGQNTDIRRIAETLGVAHVLEGSVRRSGNRIRVTAQLITAGDGSHLWSQRYDREMADIFEVQDEIAAAIAAALQVKLAPKAAAAERYKPNLLAYEACLRGRHYLLQVSSGWFEKAKECYEQAIALDPKFALPYAELAGLFNQTVALGMRSPQEIVPQVRFYAEKALELDPSLPEAHIHLGMAAAMFDFDWTEAQRRIALALAHPSVSPLPRFLYNTYLTALRRPLEAVEQIRRVVEQDPLSAFYRSRLGLSLWTAGRDEEALLEVNRARELDDHSLPYFFLAMYHSAKGAFREALPFAEKSYSPVPYMPQPAGLLAGLLARTGDAVRSQTILSKLGSPTVFGVPRGLALFHLIAGETEKAADWCERAIEQRDGFLAISTAYPSYRPLRESPRWPKLAKMMNLPEGV